MSRSLKDQAERLYESFSELVKAYQYRDREEICCHGISVSQCHALEFLEKDGPMPIGALARACHLEISSMTRLVEKLCGKKLVTRVQDTSDRRVWFVRITRQGKALIATIRSDVIDEHREVLRAIPSSNRESVLQAIEGLRIAFLERRSRMDRDNEKARSAS